MFWDKNEQIKQPFIPKCVFAKKMEHIRKEFAKTIFEEGYKNLYQIQDEAKADLNDEISILFDIKNTDAETQYFRDMFFATSSKLCDFDMINPYFTKRQISIVTDELLRIKKLLLKNGSLKYGYQSKEIKDEINKAVQKIIACNLDCKKSLRKLHSICCRHQKDI